SLAAWTETLSTTIEKARRDLRWITEDEVSRLLAARPGIADVEPAVARSALGGEPLVLTKEGTRRWVRTVNDEIAAAIMRSHRQFFDTIENTPLTDEQVRAVVTYDN